MMGPIANQVGEALRQMTKQAPLDGLIIDNRQNSGGADTILRGVLGYFTSGSLGILSTGNQTEPYRLTSKM